MPEGNTEVTLNEGSVKAIATSLDMEASELTTELTKEGESEIITGKLNDLSVMPKADLETLKTNIGDLKYKEGKKAGPEMWAKEKKTELELEGEGLNDPNALLEAYKTKIISDANIAPDKQVEQLNKEKSALQVKVTGLEGDIETKGKEFESFKTKADVRSSVHISAMKVNIIASDELVGNQREMIITSFTNTHEVKTTEDGSIEIWKDNQKQVDSLQNAITLDAAVLNHAMTLVKVGDTATKGRKDLDEVNKNLTESDGALAKIETEEDLTTYMTRTLNLNPNTDHVKCMEIRSRWVEIKNPDKDKDKDKDK